MKSPLIQILSPLAASAVPLSSSELVTCVTLARHHGLEMLLYSQLKRHCSGSNIHVDEYLEENRNLFLKNAAISMLQEKVEKEVIETLGKQGIPACIIKGNEIARTLYGDPNCRSSADIDIMIRKSDVRKADSILRRSGYASNDNIPLIYYMHSIHHAGYRDSATGNLIELHWTFGVPYFFRLSSEEIWEEVVVSDDGCAKLSPSMLLIILLIHHHSHSFRELKILVDILWAFHKYDQSIGWPEFAVRLKRLGLVKTTLISLTQLESLWSEETYAMQSVRILKRSLMDMGCNAPNFLVTYFRMDIDMTPHQAVYRDKFVARFALDGLHTTFLSYMKTLFPPPDAIRALYPASLNAMLPVNYLRFICWRVKDWSGFTKQ